MQETPLTVSERTSFKIILLSYSSFVGSALTYIGELCVPA